MSILLYGCTARTLTKCKEKKLDGNYTRMFRPILNMFWRQQPTKQQLYGHLPPITKTIKVRRTRHAGHCCRRKDEFISDILLWTPSHGREKVGRPARTFIQQFFPNRGISLEDFPGAMDFRDGWRESIRDIRAGSTTWWWWCLTIDGSQTTTFGESGPGNTINKGGCPDSISKSSRNGTSLVQFNGIIRSATCDNRERDYF